MLGQGLGLFIYARNLWLIRRERCAAPALDTNAPPAPHA